MAGIGVNLAQRWRQIGTVWRACFIFLNVATLDVIALLFFAIVQCGGSWRHVGAILAPCWRHFGAMRWLWKRYIVGKFGAILVPSLATFLFEEILAGLELVRQQVCGDWGELLRGPWGDLFGAHGADL